MSGLVSTRNSSRHVFLENTQTQSARQISEKPRKHKKRIVKVFSRHCHQRPSSRFNVNAVIDLTSKKRWKLRQYISLLTGPLSSSPLCRAAIKPKPYPEDTFTTIDQRARWVSCLNAPNNSTVSLRFFHSERCARETDPIVWLKGQPWTVLVSSGSTLQHTRRLHELSRARIASLRGALLHSIRWSAGQQRHADYRRGTEVSWALPPCAERGVDEQINWMRMIFAFAATRHL